MRFGDGEGCGLRSGGLRHKPVVAAAAATGVVSVGVVSVGAALSEAAVAARAGVGGVTHW